eukprot:SAG11_NODE_4183_length_2024_cov_2.920519_2_plen_82_part_00
MVAQVWEATEKFCEHMCAELRPIFQGASVLDLGAGTGVTGIVAAALGATDGRYELARGYTHELPPRPLGNRTIHTCAAIDT